MAMSVKEYLLLYFRQRHFDLMPDAIRAQFDVYAKNDDFRGDMKSWKRDLMENGANKPLPDAKKELDKSAWESLFRSLQDAFISMSANKDSFKDNDAVKEFLDKYFGDPRYKIFSLTPVPDSIKTSVSDFINIIMKDQNAFALLGDMFNDDYDEYKNFVKDLDKGKYNENPNTRKKLIHIVSSLSRRLGWGDISNDVLRQKLETLDLNGIINGFNTEKVVDASKLKLLKNEYQNILNVLHDNSKIYDVFKQFDNGKISKQLDEAIAKTDYTGKITEKDCIPPKRKDEKTVWQEIEGKVKDTYADVFKKYVTAHRDRIFIKQSAKTIFGALDGAKIKPTDGIAAILDNAKKISDKLKYKSPKASEDFEWFVKIMTDFKDTMPKAFEGALRNGHQMKRIVEEMVLEAINTGKVEQAKTAMEVLSVMQYGLFTSRTMDAINKTDVNIFSDGKLSWNKNEGIQTVTKALDKTIKFGIQGIGYAATAAVNGIRRLGKDFNNSGKLKKKSDQWEIDNLSAKTDAEREKVKANKNDKAEIKQLRIHKASLGITNVRQSEKALRNNRKIEDQQRQDYENAANAFAPYKDIENDFQTITIKEKAINDCQTEITRLESELSVIPNPAPDQLQEALAEQKRQELSMQKTELLNLQQDLHDTQSVIDNKYSALGTTLTAEHARIHAVPAAGGLSPFDAAKRQMDDAKNILDATENANKDLERRISEYRSDKESIASHQQNIKRRNEEFEKWDDKHKNEYLELMAYWDFLQTGKTKNLFHLSTKKLQAKMDKGRMQTLLSQYTKSYAA